MAVAKNDLVLRDRLQFTLNGTGDLATVYGRIDLSDYVNAVEKKGLNIKEVLFQPRDPNSTGLPNTGVFINLANKDNASGSAVNASGLKIIATTRAYESIAQVGIGSPDVIAVEEWACIVAPSTVGQDPLYTTYHNRYGPVDLHPHGMTVVSDLLIGVSSDNYDLYDEDTLEIDIIVIASPVTVNAKDLTQMLTQSQDL